MSANLLVNYAYAKVVDTFNNGNSITNLLNEFARRADVVSGEIVLIGAIKAVIEIGVEHRKIGLIKNQQSVLNNDKEILFVDLNRILVKKGGQDAGAWITDICSSVDAISKTSRCKIELTAAGEATNAGAVMPNVNVHIVMPDISKVEIVSMPDRVTTTDVARDDALEITKLTHVQADAR